MCEIYLESVDFTLLLRYAESSQTKMAAPVVLYLVRSNLTLDANQMMTIYQKRWKIEEYHRSLKQNAALDCSCGV